MVEMKVCIIGLGYIGLPTAIIVADHGVEVVGVDVNPAVVKLTNEGRLHIRESNLEEILHRVLETGRLRASQSLECADVFIVVVPTPLTDEGLPDTDMVRKAVIRLVPLLKEGNLVIIESTVPVGTTEKMVQLAYSLRPELKGKIHVAYCPERVLPGNIVTELIGNDRIIGGMDKESVAKANEFYSLFVKGDLLATDLRTAEMCKLTENASRDVQIAFANELSIICEKAGINVRELIRLANRHPRVNILQPGCGVGGHCIAVDPYFLTSAFPKETALIAQARATNNYKAAWCTEKIWQAISEFSVIKGRVPTVALLGLSFKPDIDDLRESPAMKIVSEIVSCGDAEFLISEPNLSSNSLFNLIPYDEAYARADIVVFLVNHKEFRQLPNDDDKRFLDFCGVTDS